MTDAPPNTEERRRATLVGAGAVFLWGTLAILTTLTGDVQPFQIVAIAFFVGFLLALVKWIALGESLTAPFRQSARAWVIGVGGLFGYHFLIFLSLKISPPVQANLINYLWPLLIVLFSALLPGQKLRLRHVAGALAGFSGACLLVAGEDSFMPAPEHIPGYAAALAGALVWASYSLASSRLTSVPTDAIGAFCLVAAILSTLAHLLFETTVTPSTGEWAALICLGLGPAGGAFFLWDWGLKRGHVRALGGFAYTAPLSSTALLIIFGPAILTGTIAIAAVLIFGGAILAAGDMLRRSPKAV
ncbi:MAG: drug/metabolite transporter (DMT)-like permease [Paracoccaceae bacterium]|jgi:drug/metabolite transporter (DMT)-like permease